MPVSTGLIRTSLTRLLVALSVSPRRAAGLMALHRAAKISYSQTDA